MLSDEFKAFLHDAGAKLAGFADMSGVPGCTYPRAVSVALPVPRHILREIADGPTRSYYYMYHELNNGLNRIITSGAEYLRARIRRRADDDRRGKTDARPPHRAATQNRGSPRGPRLDRTELPARHAAVRLSRSHIDAAHRRAARLRASDSRTALRRVPRMRRSMPSAGVERKSMGHGNASRRNSSA